MTTMDELDRDQFRTMFPSPSAIDEEDPIVKRLRLLRQPFPDSMIGKLPRYTGPRNTPKNERQKGECRECGKWHELPAIHLDYCGHAAVVDRLLAIDPFWTWEPLALDEDGTPRIRIVEGEASMWGRLTVCGVTRIGVGIAEANKNELEKQLISDFLRNAAQRFGVALDLWSKEDLQAAHERSENDEPPQGASPPPPPLLAPAEDLWQLQLRAKSLPPVQAGTLKQWWHERELVPAWRMPPQQYALADAYVAGMERMARETGEWNARSARHAVTKALAASVAGIVQPNGPTIPSEPPESHESALEGEDAPSTPPKS